MKHIIGAAGLALAVGLAGLMAAPAPAAAHGCHRYAEDGPGGWHRHVGRNCRRVYAPRSFRNPYSRCTTRCRYVGPIKQCRRYCR